jgi:hypothetical protein
MTYGAATFRLNRALASAAATGGAASPVALFAEVFGG